MLNIYFILFCIYTDEYEPSSCCQAWFASGTCMLCPQYVTPLHQSDRWSQTRCLIPPTPIPLLPLAHFTLPNFLAFLPGRHILWERLFRLFFLICTLYINNLVKNEDNACLSHLFPGQISACMRVTLTHDMWMCPSVGTDGLYGRHTPRNEKRLLL